MPGAAEMARRTVVAIGRACFASYLINGETGDLRAADLEEANAFAEYLGGRIVDCGEEPHFGTPDYPPGALRGDCLPYTALVD